MQEKSLQETQNQISNLHNEMATKTDYIKTLETKTEETQHTNNAKTQEIIKLEDQLRESKSELNASKAQQENIIQNVSF